MTKEIVASQPALVVASTTVATTALIQNTRTIPIVFMLVSDPVGSGFIESFPRPGGNVTGFTTMEPTMATKWLELLKDIALNSLGCTRQPGQCPYIHFYLEPFSQRGT